MKKFEVTAALPVFITVTVEAEDEDDAIDAAWESFSLRSYCGNGGIGNKLVGVDAPNVSIEAGEIVIEDELFKIDVVEI